MTSQLNVDTIVDKAGSGGTNVKIANTSVTVGEGGSATTTTVQGLAKAWINFTCVSSTSARDSLNVSSLTDLATGSTRVTYTSAMNNANYSATGYSNFDAAFAEGDFDATLDDRGLGLVGRATTTIQHYSYTIDAAQQDVQVLGDLA